MKEEVRSAFRFIPSVNELLSHPEVLEASGGVSISVLKSWVQQVVEEYRAKLINGELPVPSDRNSALLAIVALAKGLISDWRAPRVGPAVNATGIILHTGLGRAVYPVSVLESVAEDLTSYVNIGVDRRTGERIERDELLEPILTELTGAESATVVNNNAAATMIVLAALCAGKEVIVSRGQLIEIGGSFRLPDVMRQSGVRLVEVGTTNRTHLRDYISAITENTAAIMRVHPSNYRIIGFTHQPELRELVELAHARNLIMIDDLGAGALIDLRQFGLPHEPTAQESIKAGADIVLFSGDKLIGGAQAGIILGRRDLIARIRKHPLMRVVRVDKVCLMILERTLQLFRAPERLATLHPLYRVMSTPVEVLERRARALVEMIRASVPEIQAEIVHSTAYVGSGSVPEQALPSVAVALEMKGLDAEELAARLRLDQACVFGRIEGERVLLDMRTVTDQQLGIITGALMRVWQTVYNRVDHETGGGSGSTDVDQARSNT